MKPEFLEQKVLSRLKLLGGGQISGGELGKIFGVTDVVIRGVVKTLRLEGHPIAGIDTDGGYRIVNRPEDLDETIKKFESLIASHAAIISALKEARRQMAEPKQGAFL